MPKTFQGIIDRLTTTVQRDDLLASNSYLDFANQAVRRLADMHSFAQMKSVGAGSVTVGNTRATLPTDFKELQSGRYPVLDQIGAAAAVLVPVFPRVEVEKLLGAGLVPPASFIYTQDASGGAVQYFLDLPSPATVVHTLSINYYAYPPVCVDPSGNATTPLIDYYFDLVLSKALSFAFESINDPVYRTHEEQFINAFGILTGEDVKAMLAIFRRNDKS